MSKILRVRVIVQCALAFLVFASTANAQSESFLLELNNAADVDANCRLTYVATNNTGVAFSTTDYEVAIFDGEGRVSSLLILEFGDLPDRKTKVIQFDLLETSCDGISRIVVNDLAGCVSNNEDSKLCLSNLITSSRTSIDFGL